MLAVADQREIAYRVLVVDPDRLTAELKFAFDVILEGVILRQFQRRRRFPVQESGNIGQHFPERRRIVECISGPQDKLPAALAVTFDSRSAMNFDHGATRSEYLAGSYHGRSVAIHRMRKPVHSRSPEWLKNPAKIVEIRR